MSMSKFDKLRYSNRHYVLAYCGEKELLYFLKNKQYRPETNNLTDNVDNAAILTLNEAIKLREFVSIKDDWQIWSVKPGVSLDYHYKEEND